MWQQVSIGLQAGRHQKKCAPKPLIGVSIDFFLPDNNCMLSPGLQNNQRRSGDSAGGHTVSLPSFIANLNPRNETDE